MEQRERLHTESWLDALPLAAFLVAPDRTILAANSAAARLAGRDPRELCGLRAHLLEDAPLALLEDEYRRALAGCCVASQRSLGPALESREGIWPTHKAPVSGTGWGDAVLLTITDAGELQEVERLLHLEREAKRRAEHAAAEAEQSSRAKSEFLAHLSHEVRHVLNGIAGLTDVARQSASGRQAEYLSLLGSSASQLLDTLNGVLDYSRIEAGKLPLISCAFSIRDLLREAMAPVEARARIKGLSFSIAFEPGVPDQMSGDPERLRQVLLNLTDNALRFTRSGFVQVSVRVESAGQRNALVAFEVADSGPGIDPAVQRVLFEPFTRSSSAVAAEPGTGLGLSICKGFVEMMGGEIFVESRQGEGSRFWFTVPLEIHSREESPRPERLRVLVVDDNAVNQKVALASLAEHEVEIASSGDEAIEKFLRHTFDVIFMDVQMPDMDGLETTAAIRETERLRGGHVPIVAMTAHAYGEDRLRCLDAGMDDFLTKPIDQRALRQLLDRIAGERRAGPSKSAPRLQRDVALSRVGGDEALLSEIAGLFLAEFPQLREAVRQAVQSGDAVALEQSAHTLKGSVANFAAQRARDALLVLEQMGRARDLSGSQAALAHLETELDALLPELSALAQGSDEEVRGADR